MSRIPAAFVVLVACSLGLPAVSHGETTLRESVDVEPGGRLIVDLDYGDVEIESHDRDAVRVDAVATGFNSLFYDFELETSDDEVHLSGELGFFHIGILSHPDVTVRVWVPRAYSLDLHTARGAVAVREIEGDVEIESSRGAIELDRVAGHASLETSRGDVRIRSLQGDLTAKTSRGAIEIEQVSGSVAAETSRGRIDVAGVGGDLRVRTSRGPIDIRRAQGEVEAETSRGPIRVVIPESTGFDLDAETSRGRIHIDDEIDVDGDRSRENVVARLNGGGERLLLRTSRNDIQIRRK